MFDWRVELTAATSPSIRKAKKITGRTLVFRDASVDDAEFILSLRTDAKKSQHLSATKPDLDAQRAWLERYSISTDQAYFIIEFQGMPIGTVRIYDPKGESFCWGSWILSNEAPKNAAIESALVVYSYAVDVLGFCRAHFDVRQGNASVWRFHESFGAIRVGESDLDYFYEIDDAAIQKSLERYRRFLPSPVVVTGS